MEITKQEVLSAIFLDFEDYTMDDLMAGILYNRGYHCLDGKILTMAKKWDFALRDLVWELIAEGKLEFTPSRRVKKCKPRGS